MREKYVIWGIGANGMNFIDIYGKENIVAIIDRNNLDSRNSNLCFHYENGWKAA